MIINFNFFGQMIGELQIKLGNGELPRGYGPQHTVYEFLRAAKTKDIGLISDVFIKKINSLVEKGRIEWFNSTIDYTAIGSDRCFQYALADEGKDHTNFRD